MPNWLKDAVFYEIYPQSFYDSNNDGIGDINGIIEKLDYIKSLGCNALWINPCYDSPFKDAGYDVRDYKKVALRYGTNNDLVRLFQRAHDKGIKVLLDLVPGHTSEEHEWFVQSGKAERNEYSDRYIWTDSWIVGGDGMPHIGGECPRNGTYIVNFFKCQPALNYGYYEVRQPWQQRYDSPECLKTREALKDIMRFWMDKGCDGYRVDMANSLVKNDDDKVATSLIWQDIRKMMDEEYPECALVSEWGVPKQAIPAGFHMDFLLDWRGNPYNLLMRDYHGHKDNSYFKADSDRDISCFMEQYLEQYEAVKNNGYISLITGNHDTCRTSFNLTTEERKLAFAFLFTMPGVPFLYYGDEIGMKFLQLPTKEGGYTRTGSRTPMQWDNSKNYGFSKAAADALYLPTDSSADAPTVEKQEKDANSLLNTVRALLKLRHETPELQDNTNLEVVCNAPCVLKRGNVYIAINPRTKATTYKLPSNAKTLLTINNASVDGNKIKLGAQSFIAVRVE